MEQLFELLGSRRRRHVLDVLVRELDWVDIDHLVDAIATREREADSPSSPECEQILISLHHNHLPKLADSGLIEYEPERNSIRYVASKERSAAVEDLLAVADRYVD